MAQLKHLLSLVARFRSNFYVQCVAVLCGTTVSDFIWARYMRNVATGASLQASAWAVLVIVIGAYLVLGYVHDKRLILPAAIGAFVGTYLAV